MAKNRKRTPAQKQALRYTIFMPHSGTEKEIGAAQWQHHLKIGNLVRIATDTELKQRLLDNPRFAIVKPGLYAYESEVTGALEFAPLQRREVITKSPKNSHQAGWQNWLYRPPFTSREEAQRLQFAALPRYTDSNPKDPSTVAEVW